MADPVPVPSLSNPDPSATCSLGMPPELMVGTMVQLIRAHFADPANIVDPILRERVWLPTPDTGIVVESIDHFATALIEARPAIIVKDHAVQPVRDGIAGRMMMTFAQDGQDRYGIRYNSSVTFFCIADTSKAAKHLATEVLDELVQFSDPIRESLKLIRFVVVERGEAFTIEESKQHFAVPITVAYQVMRTWVVERQSPRIKRFLLHISAEAGGESLRIQ
jgi:hypothetical protein